MAAQELRMVIAVDDYDRVVRFYRDVVGLSVDSYWDRDDGRGTLFDSGKATLEIMDRTAKESGDMLEAGRVVPGDVRIALRVGDVDTAYHELVVDGAPLMSHPLDVPWGHRVARLQTPHGMQMTLFSEL